MKAKAVFSLFVATVIATGCASYRPIVDMRGVDPGRYESDLRECQSYAQQVEPAGQAAAGAVIGAVFVGAIGAVLCGRECARTGAALGGIQGAGVGAADGAGGQIQVIRNCMIGRGYAVLR